MNKNMNYLDRVVETCIAANNKSMRQPSGWDNKKKKSMKQYLPRGQAYRRVVERENMAWFESGKLLLSEANQFILNNFQG